MVAYEKDLYEKVINSPNTERSDIINSFIFNYLSCSGFKDVNVLFSGSLGVFSKSVLLGKLSVDEYDNIDFVGALKYIEITHKSIRKDVLKLMVERILHFYMFYRSMCNISPLNNDIFNNLGARLGVVLSEKHGYIGISDDCDDFSSMVRILVGQLHDVLGDILCDVNECLEDNGVPRNMRNFDVKTIIGCFEDIFMSGGMSRTSFVGRHDIESKYNYLDLLSYDNNKKRKLETEKKQLQSSTITKLSFCKKLSLGGRILDLKHSTGMSQSRVCCVIQKEGCCVVELYNTYIDDIFESQKVYSDMIDDNVVSVCFHRDYMGYVYIAKGDSICCSHDNARLHTPGVIYTSISQLYENVFMVGCSDGFVVLYDTYTNFLPKIRLSNEPIVSIDGSITKKYAVDKHGVVFALMAFGRDDKMSYKHTPEISTSIITSHAYSVFGAKRLDVCVNPQNDNVVLLRIDNNVYLLELSLSIGVYKFKEMARCSYNTAVVSVCFAQTGDHLIVLFEDGELVSSHIENLHDSKLLVTLDETPACMCTGYSDSSLAADYYILIGTRSGSLIRYDVE